MWKRDQLSVVLLLAAFALMGAECTPIHQKETEDKRLPNRADISPNGLVRTYYDTASTPSRMTRIKIPEGKKFDDNELTVNLGMGGTLPVTEVRVRLAIQPPSAGKAGDVDLQARVIRPDGLTGAWQGISLVNGSVLKSQVEFAYVNDLDGGTDTSGNWKIQIRDNIDDDDGRCIFRNATLILNGGGVSGTGGTDEVATATGSFGSLPEIEGGQSIQDWGFVGVNRMRVNQFTLANAGVCAGISLSFSLKHSDVGEPNDKVQVLVIAPDGAWSVFTPDFSGLTSIYELAGVFKISTGSFDSDNTLAGSSFEFLGSATSGTWTVAMWDSVNDSEIFEASADSANAAGTAIVPNTDWTLTVTRQ